MLFGTTVGWPGHFMAGATREDQAIGTWRAEAAFTGLDINGNPGAFTSPNRSSIRYKAITFF